MLGIAGMLGIGGTPEAKTVGNRVATTSGALVAAPWLPDRVGVADGVCVGVSVAVGDGVGVSVAVSVGTGVGVPVGTGVSGGSGVSVGGAVSVSGTRKGVAVGSSPRQAARPASNKASNSR
jgi:hypothetical protein